MSAEAPEGNGQWAMATFIEATQTCDEQRWRELMDAILDYNREDLLATWAVFEWLKQGSSVESRACPHQYRTD